MLLQLVVPQLARDGVRAAALPAAQTLAATLRSQQQPGAAQAAVSDDDIARLMQTPELQLLQQQLKLQLEAQLQALLEETSDDDDPWDNVGDCMSYINMSIQHRIRSPSGIACVAS
jgi:hypothetical protein